MLKTKAGAIVGSGAPPGQIDDRDVLMTRAETASYLKVSLQTLELWARNGEGPKVVHIGRGVRYTLDDVRRFVAGNRPQRRRLGDHLPKAKAS
jgi:excisionase family DNA binding protein